MFVTESAVLAPAACTQSAESLAIETPVYLERKTEDRVQSIRTDIQGNGQLKNDTLPSPMVQQHVRH